MKVFLYLILFSIFNFLYANETSKPEEARSLSNVQKTNSDKLFAGSKIVFVSHDPKPGSATEFVIASIISLEKLLADIKVDSKTVTTKDPEIKRIVSAVLDLKSLGKEALSNHWAELSKSSAGKKQVTRYESLFRSLVEENYLQKIRHYIGGQHHIHFTSEAPAKEMVKVMARILKDDVDVIVEFDAVKDGKSWKIVDTKLDETSLEETYRNSFSRIIRKNGGLKTGFPELLRVMDKRLADLRKGKATQL